LWDREARMNNAEIIETVQLWRDTIKNDAWVDYDMRQKHEKVLARLKELLKEGDE
jgi:hypothetical protein